MSARFRRWGPESVEITLNGQLRQCERGRLGTHLELGEILDVYQEEVETRRSEGVCRAFTSYLRIGVGLGQEEVGGLSFLEAGEIFLKLQDLNRLRFFPPFLDQEKDETEPPSEAPPWNYKGRELHIWIHTLASAYHWARSEILNLVPEEAVIYVQEVMIDQQFEREWEYNLSGRGVIYNPKTRTSRFRPLLRPKWMVKREPTIVKIPKSLLPVGVVIYGPGPRS